jgi:hypothetical protein
MGLDLSQHRVSSWDAHLRPLRPQEKRMKRLWNGGWNGGGEMDVGLKMSWKERRDSDRGSLTLDTHRYRLLGMNAL